METPAGWMFADSNEVPWQELAPGVEMKALGAATGRVIAMFRFAPGYEGASHHHDDAEFSYVLEGDLTANGVLMQAGHAYAASAGTTHDEFRTDTGCTVVSVFPVPPGMA